MEYLSASQMKERADNSTKVSEIASLTKVLTDKIFEYMVTTADKKGYKLDVNFEYRSRAINLDQSDCDLVADKIREYLICKGYTASKFSVDKGRTSGMFGNNWVWTYSVSGTVSWE